MTNPSPGKICNSSSARRYDTVTAENGAEVRRRTSREVPGLEDREREDIARVLFQVDGNKTRAAEILGIDRVSLWRKLKRREMG